MSAANPRYPDTGSDRLIRALVMEYQKLDNQSGAISINVREALTTIALYLNGDAVITLVGSGGHTNTYDGDELKLILGDSVGADYAISFAGIVDSEGPISLPSGSIAVIKFVYVGSGWIECYRKILSD